MTRKELGQVAILVAAILLIAAVLQLGEHFNASRQTATPAPEHHAPYQERMGP